MLLTTYILPDPVFSLYSSACLSLIFLLYNHCFQFLHLLNEKAQKFMATTSGTGSSWHTSMLGDTSKMSREPIMARIILDFTVRSGESSFCIPASSTSYPRRTSLLVVSRARSLTSRNSPPPSQPLPVATVESSACLPMPPMVPSTSLEVSFLILCSSIIASFLKKFVFRDKK